MACLLNVGITRTCAHSVGGLQALYLANREEIATVGINANGIVTGVTAVTGGTPNFYKIEFEPQTGQLTEPLIVGAVTHFNPTLNFTIANIDQAKRLILNKISLGTFTGIAHKSDGKKYLVGYDCAGLKAASLEANSGLAQTDGDVAVVSLAGASLDYAHEISNSVFTSLIAV